MDSEIKIEKSEQEWRELLTPEQFYVTRQKGTERAFSGEYYHEKRRGIYRCVCCGAPLFSSEHKYDSGSGWPSFWQPAEEGRLDFADDFSILGQRVETRCKRCGAHLGHVFHDGPPPTGQRYCINSAALVLDGNEAEKK